MTEHTDRTDRQPGWEDVRFTHPGSHDPKSPQSTASPARGCLAALSSRTKVGIGAVLLPAMGLNVVVPAVMSKVLGIGLLALALAFGIRFVMHVFAGYFTSLCLGTLTLVSGLVPAGLTIAGVAALNGADPWLELAAVTGLLVGMVLISSAMVEAIVQSDGRYRRASEVIPEWRLIRTLRGLLGHAENVPFVKHLNGLFGSHTPPHYVSGFIAITAAIVLLMVAAFAAEAVMETARDDEHATGTTTTQTAQKPTGGDRRGATAARPPARPPRQQAPKTSPAAATAPAAAPEPVTYEDLCGTAVVPGTPAPEPQATALHDLWLGGPGRTGAGALEAGCAIPARQVGITDTWYAQGLCGTDLRALGVAQSDGSASLLLQQAARFALAQAEAGRLVGASDRIPVHLGDLYVISTSPQGTWILARSRASAGRIDSQQPRRSCDQPTSENVSYTVLPPVLTELWMQLLQRQWAWPALDSSAEGPGRSYVFLADGPAQRVIAHATCSDRQHCELEADGKVTMNDRPSRATAEEVRALVP